MRIFEGLNPKQKRAVRLAFGYSTYLADKVYYEEEIEEK
jgi:hypothetical protein